ncbi:MAG: DUF6000 family protein [Umezawaea sp.]
MDEQVRFHCGIQSFPGSGRSRGAAARSRLAARRPCRTAAWLIAVARRTEFRDQLGSLLLASEIPFADECTEAGPFGRKPDGET